MPEKLNNSEWLGLALAQAKRRNMSHRSRRVFVMGRFAAAFATEGAMSETEQKLAKYVGYLVEGALKFRNAMAVGVEVPDFELPDLNGRTFRLSAYRGKSNIVLIFGSFTDASTVTQLRVDRTGCRRGRRRSK